VADADIINADGMGIVWGAKILGKKLPERVAGIDVFTNLLKIAEEKGYPVYFFGATDEVLKNMITNIKNLHPKIRIAGYRNGYYKEIESKKIAQNIKKSKAQILFVGISSPMKERFIKNQLKNTGVSFAMGVGGSFDVLSGKTKRAPKWMQNIGLEWFYRLIQEPRRMTGRYAVTNTKFIMLIIKEKFNKK
jgi:N-acetylglucosaminyldiphosphoundecaprenol N-acetyl-beta-D-mannosaminyltransferase